MGGGHYLSWPTRYEFVRKDGDALAIMFPMIRRWWTKDPWSGLEGAKWTAVWTDEGVSHENTFCDQKREKKPIYKVVMRKNLFLLCYLIVFWDGNHFIKKRNQLCVHKMYDHIWLAIISGKARVTKGYRTEISGQIYFCKPLKVHIFSLALKRLNPLSFSKFENPRPTGGGGHQ